MRALGVVQWTKRDKLGQQVAGVRPLFEVDRDLWRPITSPDEFPTNGQVFWPNAPTAVEGMLVTFRTEHNLGQKDEFKVAEPKPVHEVLDLRAVGTASEVRASLASGVHLFGHTGSVRMSIWCMPDVLVGPVELVLETSGRWKLHGANLANLPTVTGAVVKTIHVDQHTRMIRMDEIAPSGGVDWDEDVHVLRRAIEVAGKLAEVGPEGRFTKRQIQDATTTLSAQGLGAKSKLELYRLEHALTLLERSDEVVERAGQLAEFLQAHPAVKSALEEQRAQAKADVERTAREELDQLLAKERAALQKAIDKTAAATARLQDQRLELEGVEQRLSQLQAEASRIVDSAQTAIKARIEEVVRQPMDLLAQVSVLRPFLAADPSPWSRPSAAYKPVLWSKGTADTVKDRAALRRVLTNAARAKGIEPFHMLQIHAAITAGLMPITVGAGGVASMMAYAHAVCGNRLLVIHVSPGFLAPRDLYDAPEAELLSAVKAAKDIDGLSIVLLEGANRSPLEAAVLPLLQLAELGASPLSGATGLRLAATHVMGAATVPVTPQLWHHAVAISPRRTSLPDAAANGGEDISLSSELFAMGESPTEAIDAVLDIWPMCEELRPTLVRLGSALSRLHEGARLQQELVQCLVLPYIATSFSEEEQTEALSSVGDEDGAAGRILRQLRRALC